MTDIVRIDHFRGFAAYWSIPADAPTAESGTWLPGPGKKLFDVIQDKLGPREIIAEDLGVITDDVTKLRQDLGYPGMSVLHFAFDGDPGNTYLPHNYDPKTVVYTGTHDNDTTQGWFDALPEEEKNRVRRYLGHSVMDAPWELMRLAQQSVARYSMVPMQDILRLGSDSRMNRPGQTGGNWSWRFTWDQIYFGLQDELQEIAQTYGRT
jgi:4-alpha-glucanotransferase